MTKTVLLAALAATALAIPAQAAPQPIFSIEKNDRKAMQPKRTVTLFDDGSWMYDEVPIDTGATIHRSGTLAADTTKTLRAELAAATWTPEPIGITCHAITSAYTSYRAAGKEVLRVQGCPSYKLDEHSAKALADVDAALAAAWVTPK
ncbi:MAG TPA: hypothetical protein VMJ10_00540 [Kofleriaceae bacterium]|nr:hypothetical protein [Kofleriaceae bacterium]